MDKKKRKKVLVSKSKGVTEIKKFKIENWAELLDKSLNEIYIFDKDTLLFEYVNIGAQKNLGYSLDKLLKMSPIDIKPEFTFTSFHSLIRPLLKHENSMLKFETVHQRADGTQYPVEVSLQLFKQKKRSCFLAFILDITERKKREEELKESEHRLGFTIQNMPMGMIEWDKDFRVTSWNPAAEKIFGYLKDEAMGKHARFIIPDEYKGQVDKVWRQLISGGANQSINGNVTKDGRMITCEWHNAPLISQDGKIFGVVSMILDITANKKVEDKLNSQIIEIEKANQLMVGRELRMIELKKTIKELESKLVDHKK